MWLVPSKGRPHLAQRLFDVGFKEKGILIISKPDIEAYSEVRMPYGWKMIVIEPGWLSETLNTGYEAFPDEEWYGILNDDHLPVTPGWERLMVEEGKKGMAWPDDNYKHRISAHVKSGNLVRKLGWFICPALKHYYLDDVDELIASTIGGRFLSEVVVSHEHVNAGRAPIDRTYLERPNSLEERRVFQEWKEKEWPKVRCLISPLTQPSKQA